MPHCPSPPFFKGKIENVAWNGLLLFPAAFFGYGGKQKVSKASKGTSVVEKKNQEKKFEISCKCKSFCDPSTDQDPTVLKNSTTKVELNNAPGNCCSPSLLPFLLILVLLIANALILAA